MDKQTAIAKLAESDEDKILLARVYDRMTTAEQRCIPAASCFLTAREQVLVQRLLPHLPLRFFGGCDGAERAVCCYVPEYLEPADWFHSDDGPICAIRATFYEKDEVTHRDVLGALMGSGIKREAVGDLYVQPGRCDFLVTREILPYVMQNLTSAGRTKLHLTELALDALEPPVQAVREIRDTVSTLRLDAVVSSGFGLSRGKASACIESGKASLNALPCTKPDRTVSEGDVISVRGLGKLELAQVLGTTKKGRTGILIRRYV